MKRFNYILILALVAISTHSCDEFLNTEPQDFLSPSLYYETESQLQSSLAGVYDVMGDQVFYKRDYISKFALQGDEGYYKQKNTVTGPQVYNFSSSESLITQLWESCYSGINRANVLLANVDNNTTISEEIRGQIRGEALFLRAYYYFILVQQYGGVPLRLEPTLSVEDTDFPRASAEEVYDQIIADMEEAEALVAPITTIGHGGRVNKSAVRGILARVCLYMAGEPVKDVSKYEKAAFWTKQVIDDAEAGHALNQDFEQVFINYGADEYDTKESIWEVEFYGNSLGTYSEHGLVGDIIGVPSSSEEYGRARGFIRTTAKLYQSYEEGDVRRDITIAPFNVDNKTGEKEMITDTSPEALYERHVGKYRREWEVLTPKASNNTPTNWPLLRYSDVLLMYAEAENEGNGPTTAAHDALNLVRARANASLFTGATAIATKEEFRSVIIDERSRELAFEGLRKPDLIRWGIFLPTMKDMLARIEADSPGAWFTMAYQNVSERDVLFPIPSTELFLNRSAEQNTGW